MACRRLAVDSKGRLCTAPATALLNSGAGLYVGRLGGLSTGSAITSPHCRSRRACARDWRRKGGLEKTPLFALYWVKENRRHGSSALRPSPKVHFAELIDKLHLGAQILIDTRHLAVVSADAAALAE